MQVQLQELIHSLRRMGELHSPATEDHAVRVREFALQMGERLELDDEALVMLQYAADVHDFGKIFVDSTILYKPGRLNKAQRGQVEKHCELGYEALEPLHLPAAIADTVLCHQEHYDGSGYPKKLRGEAIPLHARIVTIADVWDALNSDRPYRPAYSATKALEIMTQCATWFDPRLYSIFLELVRGKSHA